MNPRLVLFPLIFQGVFIASAHAAVTLVAEYHLGESGSISGPNQNPQDSVGSRHFSSPINGVAQGTYSGTPVHGAAHLSVAPGGATYFDGQMDEARVVTFTGGESTANILNTLTAVPEPSAMALGVLGALAVLRRRRD
ncbi:MAG: PEP-CTERM sorting domain-containing protein [Akkermansiaceae bacterium]|nr:PEP-CTERM sorting domain-containing protein [Akkermansiaceae bacterium]